MNQGPAPTSCGHARSPALRGLVDGALALVAVLCVGCGLAAVLGILR